MRASTASIFPLAITWLCHDAAAQSASLPGPPPPAAHGFSLVALQLGKSPRFTSAERGWSVSAQADVAIKNSATRVALSATRLPPLTGANSTFGLGVAVTQVMVERESPARLLWITAAVGGAGLGNELRSDASVLELSVGGGGAQLFTPPGIGEFSLSLSPRIQYRRLRSVPGIEQSSAGIAARATLDWASQRSFGALVSFDVEWLSSRPAGDRLIQTTVQLGASYRTLLFARKPRLPPPEE